MKTAKKSLLFSFFLFFSLMNLSCSITADAYKSETPVFDMASYFNGNLQAWGIFQDYSGKVIKRFKVNMTGSWTDNNGTLDEHFIYADGSTQRRVWKLTKHNNSRFSGTASDVIGIAEGKAAGNALRWRYTMALDVEGEIYHVQFDDWMYMIDKDTVINRSVMQKFGITVGEVTLVFQRAKDEAQAFMGQSQKQHKPIINRSATVAIAREGVTSAINQLRRK